MHQVKTQSSRRGPQQAEMTSSKASTKRRTVSQEHTHDTVKTKELGTFFRFTYEVLSQNLRKLNNAFVRASERIRGASNFMPSNRVRTF